MTTDEQKQHDEIIRALRWFLDVYDGARLRKGGLTPPKDGWTHFQTAAYIGKKALEGEPKEPEREQRRPHEARGSAASNACFGA